MGHNFSFVILGILLITVTFSAPSSVNPTTINLDDYKLELKEKISLGNSYISDIAISGNIAYVADSHEGLKVVDISNHSNPTIIKSVPYTDGLVKIEVVGNYLYAKTSTFLDMGNIVIFDISAPLSPVFVSRDSTNMYDFVVDYPYLYLGKGDFSGGIEIWDVTTGNAPVLVKENNTMGAFLLDIQNNMLFIGDDYSGHIKILDVTDPNNLQELGFIDLGEGVHQFKANGTLLYAIGESSFFSYNITDPLAPVQLDSYYIDSYSSKGTVAVKDQYVFYTQDSEYGVYDLKNPANIIEKASYYVSYLPTGMVLVDNTTILTHGPRGLGLYNHTILNSQVQIGLIDPYTDSYDEVIRVDNYIVASSNYDGLLLFGKNSSGSYVLLDQFHSSYGAYDLKYSNGTIYVSFSNILYGFSIVNDKFQLQDTYALPVDIFVHSAFGFAIHDDIVYLSNSASGMDLLNVSNPSMMVFENSFYMSATAVHDAEFVGDVMYVATGLSGFIAFNISDTPNTITQLYNNSAISSYFCREVTLVGTTLYVMFGTYGVQIYDIAVPTAPNYIKTIDLPSYSAYDLVVNGSLGYLQAYGELVVVNFTDPYNFDVVATADISGLGGVFVDSQIITGSDNGIEIWELVEFEPTPNNTDTSTNTSTDTNTSTISNTDTPSNDLPSNPPKSNGRFVGINQVNIILLTLVFSSIIITKRKNWNRK